MIDSSGQVKRMMKQIVVLGYENLGVSETAVGYQILSRNDRLLKSLVRSSRG